MQYLSPVRALFVLSLHVSLVLAQLSPTDCSHSVTITTGQNSCNRLDAEFGGNYTAADQWQCPDLQSALEVAAAGVLNQVNSSLDREEGQNTSNCVSIMLPPGDHFITAPLYFGAPNYSLYLFGLEDGPDDVTIFCNYTVDVNESRMFDPNYNYTDYTFYFDRSQQVSIENVQFVGCPFPLRMDTVATVGVFNSTFRNFTEAVFDIFNSANVSITVSNFVDNSGTGISRHSFRANTGAVAVGYNNIPTFFQQISLKVSGCNFINNRATASRMFRSTNSAFFSRIFTGRGGALGVFYNESFYNITARISDNHFENNFARSFGGSIFIVYFGNGTQNVNILERNSFFNNIATFGGGAVLSTFISNGVPERPHSTIMSDCIFYGNQGQSGGALFVYQAYELFGVSLVRCERCNFTNNRGINTTDGYGAAVGIYLVNQFGSIESAPRYEFIDCSFEQNSGNNGIFTVAYTPLSFSGTTRFIGNKGTDALRVIGSLVDFKGEVLFINNTDKNAVAMHLLSFGQARVFPGLQMVFWGSKGTFGASILVDSQTSSIAFSQLAFNPQCFAVHGNSSLSPEQWNDVSVSFQNNSAILGSSLFISRLDACSWISTDADPAFNNTFLFDWPIWNFGNDSTNTGYLDPYNPEHSVVTTVHSFSTANQSVMAWPGQRFVVKLIGVDQFSHLTTANARLTFSSESQELTVSFNPQLVVIDVAEDESLVEDFTVTYSISTGDALVVGKPLGMVTIDEPIQNIVVKPATFTLYPLPCPAGYDLVSAGQQQGGLECQCDKNNKLIINCEDDQDTLIVEEGYWGSAVLAGSTGYRYDLFLHACPPGYCKCSQNTSLGSTSCGFTYTNSDPDAQCVCNRQGIFCGSCRDGRGVSALLNNCVTCHNAQGLLILGLILADAIAFIVIVVTDVSLPGLVYPFIFYIQVVPSVAIYFPETFIKGGKFLHFVSSALGFYFVYDFCLYSNMSPLVSYFIRYLPVLVALLLLPAVFVLRKIKRLVLKHHGIWWVILLLYSHLVHTSMSILECPFLPNYSFPRWFVNGDIACFTGWHAPLALLAIAVLVIAVLLIPFVGVVSMKIHFFKHLYWLRYFEDPLTVVYKKKWRWWSAVELARRFIFILFVIPFPRNSIPPLMVMCIMLVAYGFVQPYKSKIANVLEAIIQVNFIVLLSLESTSGFRDVYSTFSPPTVPTDLGSNATSVCRDDLSSVSVFTTILLPFYYAPILSFVVLGIVNFILYIRNRRQKIKEAWQRRSTTRRLGRSAVNVTSTEVGLDDSHDISGSYTKATL